MIEENINDKQYIKATLSGDRVEIDNDFNENEYNKAGKGIVTGITNDTLFISGNKNKGTGIYKDSNNNNNMYLFDYNINEYNGYNVTLSGDQVGIQETLGGTKRKTLKKRIKNKKNSSRKSPNK
jgi:hypothetical protein